MRHFTGHKQECDQCHFSSGTNDNMATHKAKWHKDGVVYKCPECLHDTFNIKSKYG